MSQYTLEVHNDSTYLKGPPLSKICTDQLKFATSFLVPGSHFSRAFQKGFWDGRTQLFNSKKGSFPTGLLSRVKKILQQNSLTYQVQDYRQKPTPKLKVKFNPPFLLRPYQQDTVNSAPTKQRGIIRIATGGGKSLCLAGIIGKLKVPTLVLIHKRDVFWQLVETLEKSLDIPIGKVGAGVIDIQPVTVAMMQTVARALDPDIKVDSEDDTEIDDPESIQALVRNSECVVVDETHRINTGWYELILNNTRNAFYRFGLSATPFRTDNADLVIEAHLAPKFVDISASYLIDNGYLAAPTIYLYPFKHKRQPADLTYAKLYGLEIAQNCARNALIVELARQLLMYDKTVLVAVTRVEHGKLLEPLLQQLDPNAIFAHGQMDSLVRKQILADLNEGKRKIVVSTTIFGEGVDVPNLSTLILAKASDSAVDTLQLVGRVLRITPTKKTATIIDIADEGCRFFAQHSKSRNETYKQEPRYNVQIVTDISEIQP